MLPRRQAYVVKHFLSEYLRATFRLKDKGVHDAMRSITTSPTPEEGIFKGPYVSLKLPFVTAGESGGAADSAPGASGAVIANSAAGADSSSIAKSSSGANSGAAGTAIPLEIATAFPPYHHQLQSFEHLTTHNGHQPQYTLVTADTSSGKTAILN